MRCDEGTKAVRLAAEDAGEQPRQRVALDRPALVVPAAVPIDPNVDRAR